MQGRSYSGDILVRYAMLKEKLSEYGFSVEEATLAIISTLKLTRLFDATDDIGLLETTKLAVPMVKRAASCLAAHRVDHANAAQAVCSLFRRFVRDRWIVTLCNFDDGDDFEHAWVRYEFRERPPQISLSSSTFGVQGKCWSAVMNSDKPMLLYR